MNSIEEYIASLASDGVTVDEVRMPQRLAGLTLPAGVVGSVNTDGTGQVVYLLAGTVVARQVPTE